MAFPPNPNPGDLYYSCGQKFVFNGKIKAWCAIVPNVNVTDMKIQKIYAGWSGITSPLPSIKIPENLLDLR